jgi:cation diffusion facilitator family transporter
LIKALTQFIVRVLVKDYRNTSDVSVRVRYGSLGAWASIMVNIPLLLIKGFLGITLNSVALIGDAVDTLSDIGISIVVLMGFKISQRPSDEEHPFGHGRAESIATLIVSVLLIVAGIELMRSAVTRILNPVVKAEGFNWAIVIIIACTIVVKEVLSRFARQLSIMIESAALEADSLHNRTDALSTSLVLLSMIFVRGGYVYVDGIAGVLVALIVIYSGYGIARNAVSPLLGERPSRELLKKIEDIASGVDGVEGVHDVIVHRYGHTNLVSLHIEVSDSQPIGQLHDLSEYVEELIGSKLGGSAVVHIDPINKNHDRYAEFSGVIGQIVRQDDRIVGFHDLRLIGHGRKIRAIFDITINGKVSPKEIDNIKHQLCAKIVKELPGVRISIKAEPRYAYSNQ